MTFYECTVMLSQCMMSLRVKEQGHFRKHNDISRNIMTLHKTQQHYTKHNNISDHKKDGTTLLVCDWTEPKSIVFLRMTLRIVDEG